MGHLFARLMLFCSKIFIFLNAYKNNENNVKNRKVKYNI